MQAQPQSTVTSTLRRLAASGHRRDQLCVLLIEDNPGDADLVQILLREVPECFIQLACASQLGAGLDALRTTAFDAVIVDLSLPDSTPTETLLRVRQAAQSVPIIVLSGSDSAALRHAALNAGTLEFLVKGEPETLTLGRRLLAAVDRHRTEGTQRQLERWISVVPDAVMVTTDDGQIQFANHEALDLLGLTESELGLERLHFSLNEGEVTEVELRRNGSTSTGQMRVIAVDWRGVPARLATFHDTLRPGDDGARLLLREQLLSIGSITASAVHELNNPLGALLLNLELAARAAATHPSSDSLHVLLTDARNATDCLRLVIEDLRVLSGTEQTQTETVDLTSAVARGLRLAGPAIRKHIQVVVAHEADLPLVRGHESGLGQVVYNLLVSAAQAVDAEAPASKRITITTRSLPDGWVELEIDQRRSGATHLGLALCERILASYGGKIELETQPEGRVKTRIALRAGAERSARTSVLRLRRRAPPAARVLVIDDDIALTTAISRALRIEHDVVVAHSGQEALDLLSTDPDFDVVLCDVTLPGAERLERIPIRKLDKPLNINELLSLIRAAVPAA